MDGIPLADLLDGFRAPQKRIGGKHLWDEAGSRLFERICDSLGYYPTGREVAILRRAAAEVAALAGEGVTLVEFGSGASQKVGILLSALPRPRRYVAIDISEAYLAEAAARVAADRPDLEVVALCADYSGPIRLPPAATGGSMLGFFPGIAIGNLSPAEAAGFLRRARDTLGSGLLLVFIDSTDDEARLRAAYADEAGLMAAFHLNVLHRLARDAGVHLPAEAFRHEVRVRRDPPRVEAHLVAQRDVAWSVAGKAFGCRAGDSILTDSSQKYPPEALVALAREAGWEAVRAWHDDRTAISLHLLRA